MSAGIIHLPGGGAVIVGHGRQTGGLCTAKALLAAVKKANAEAPQVAKVKFWTCNNCGHLAEQTPQLKELAFKWVAPLTSKTTCPNCGSYTLQQAYDETFKAGYFVVVKAYNGIRGKGRK